MTGFGRTGAWFGIDALRRPARPPRRRQGRDVRLLAVRVRRGLGRGVRRGHRRRRRSSTGSRTRTSPPRRPSPSRCCGSSRPSRWSRRPRPRASGCWRCSTIGSTRTPRSATSAGAACSSAWSSSATARRASRIRGRRSLVEAIVERGASARPAALLGHGQRERRRRRHDPARAAVRRHRRRAGPDRRRAGRGDRGGRRGGGGARRSLSASATGPDAVSSPAWSKSRRPTPSSPRRSSIRPRVRRAAAAAGWWPRSPSSLLAIGGLAAVLVTTGRLGQPAKPAARVAIVDPDGALAIVDGQGGNRVVHAPAGTAFRFPAWSPDGTRVAAVANTATGAAIRVYSTATGRLGVARRHRGLPERRHRRPSTCTGRRTVARSRSSPQEADSLALRSAPADGSADATVLREGNPMYWTWEDGDRMLVHTGADTSAFLGRGRRPTAAR